MKAVNLLPPDLRGASRRGKSSGSPAPEASGGSGPFVVLGALALSVAAAGGYVLAENTIEHRKSELVTVTAQHEAAAREAAALKPYATFQEAAAKRIQTVQTIAAQRFNWDQALDDVSRAIPADATLDSLAGSVGPGAASGSSGARSAVAAPAIDLKGCVPTQDDVPALMSRLRTVRGVTRVALTRAVKAVAQGGAVASAPAVAGGKAQGPACKNPEAPRFELTVFFERATTGGAAAPAAAGAAAPAATPAPGTTAAPAATPAPGSTTTPASTTGTTTP